MPQRTLAELTQRVLHHRDERDWAQFHTPKELAVSLVVEAAELLALMQWKTGEELKAVVEKRREQVRDELADVLHSVLLLASDLGVNLGDALEQKLEKDAKKYPVEKARGRADKYTEYEDDDDGQGLTTRPADPLHSFHAFTTTHAVVLVGLAFGTAVACALGVRYRGTPGLRRGERVAGFVMLALWIAWQGVGWLPANYKIEEALPLQMCDLTSLAAPLVLLTRARLLRTLLYFWGLGLSIQALITPTIEEGPLYVAFWLFWLTHAAIIATAGYDLIAWRFRPTFRDAVIAIVACTVWLGVVLTVDLALAANYGYVGNATPDRPTVIDQLGPWPLRVYKMYAAMIVLFLAMWFPWWLVRGRAMIGGTSDQRGGGVRE